MINNTIRKVTEVMETTFSLFETTDIPQILNKLRNEGKLGYPQVGLIYFYSKNDVLEFLNYTHLETFVYRRKR